MTDEKRKALEIAMETINKNYGKGTIMKLGDNSENANVETFSTGCYTLDKALGRGIPKGRIIEVYGPESAGKTTIALHMISEIQKTGGVAAFIDVEHALDPVYAENIGVDTSELLFSQPDCGEHALEICENIVRSGAADIVVIDSVAALVPKAEIDGDMGDSHIGLQARLMSQALRKLTSIVSQTKCTVVFINQIREKVGIMFGNPETTCGGNALKFYSSVRMEIRKKETVKVNGEAAYNKVKIKIVKNKVAPPFREVLVDVTYGQGIDTFGCLVDALVENDIIHKAGAWFSYNGENIAQGRDKLISYLKENEDVLMEVKSKLDEI